MTAPVTAILDIGKTNVKLCLLDDTGQTVWSRYRRNEVVGDEPYPHFDVDALWQWLLAALTEAAEAFAVEAINVSTHGACAALVKADGALAMPVLDYEYAGVEECDTAYNAVRPDFLQTYSPNLPAGLNLGRQLFWLKDRFPEGFNHAVKILMYPQYWTWRLTGVATGEVTSLGCHTDLWNPVSGDYSSLVDVLDVREKLPASVSATSCIGNVSIEVARQTGLPQDCRVFAGVHDSNASFARHLSAGLNSPFAVISTGTWVITMANGIDLSVLDEQRDTLANVSALGEPLACARFMGGREFEEICRLTDSGVDGECSESDIAELVAAGEFALPAFAKDGGPFPGLTGKLPAKVKNGKALATLYTALMIDYELDLLGADGDILLGSSSSKNPLLCNLLAQLRGGQRVLLSGDEASTVTGAWVLTRPDFPRIDLLKNYVVTGSAQVSGLGEYRDEWRRRAER